MDTYDDSEKLAKVFKYGKYILPVLIVVIVFLVIRSCQFSYAKVENALVDEAKKYIKDNNISVSNDTYIEAINLDVVEGTELCSKATGVLITNENGNLKYQAYLDCPDYKSEVFKNPEKYIKLNGGNLVVLNRGEVYQELGYDILKQADIEEVKGNSNSNIYSVTYNAYIDEVLKETAIRKIVVVNDKTGTLTNLQNSSEPVILLKGDRIITLNLNSRYEEAGYTAYDYEDGKISRNVKVTGEVNTKKEGTYVLTYSVTNSKGNSAILTREVSVVRQKSDLTIDLSYNKSISNKTTITGKVTGKGFSHIILPNNSKINDSNFTYNVEQNGTYKFVVYDIYENKFAKEIEIKELDKSSPTGTCEADYRTKSVTVTVNAKDDKGIKNYEYIIGSSKETSTENKFVKAGEFNKNNSTTVKVNVQDIAGNVASLTCSTVLNLVPSMYRDSLGYDCLEPYTCYKQKDYSDPYQATINGVGTIYRSGCLPTSLTIISTKFNKRSKSGELYTPPTLIKEIIYPDGVIRGYSNYKRVQEVAAALNLKISQEYPYSKNKDILIEHLKTGNPALILVTKGCLAAGAHYMAILGINDQNQIFLSDPNSRTNKSAGSCPVNTWVGIDDLRGASIETFVLFSE